MMVLLGTTAITPARGPCRASLQLLLNSHCCVHPRGTAINANHPVDADRRTGYTRIESRSGPGRPRMAPTWTAGRAWRTGSIWKRTGLASDYETPRWGRVVTR